jgi:hypothetical protein
MDVHLLVYDLSRGLARQMSRDLLGFQLDAVYHTSIKLNGREYVYDGNVVSIIPGTSHLGRPLQELYLGKTNLTMDVVEEYLDSLREVYTMQVRIPWPRPAAIRANETNRRMISSHTIATTSPMTWPLLCSAREYRITFYTCHKLS